MSPLDLPKLYTGGREWRVSAPQFHENHMSESRLFSSSPAPNQFLIVKPPQDAAGTQRTIKAGLSLRPCGVLRRFDVPILVVLI